MSMSGSSCFISVSSLTVCLSCLAPTRSLLLVLILSNLCHLVSAYPGLVGDRLWDLLGEELYGLYEEEAETGLAMGDRERMLSRHLSSVWKWSGISSHFIAMLQMGHTAWSDLNLLLERLDRSSASSYLFWRLTASGLEVGGRGRKGFGKGKAEGVKVLVTAA